MKIDKYIHELLYQHDCVIVPGLGGFIANYQSAYFNPSLQIFYPPSKKIAFNSELKENDGLLAKHVSKKQGSSYDDANNSIREAVRGIYESLKTNKLVEIEKVGSLRYNKESNIEFNPGNESNYLLSSFGMSPVQAPAIKRTVADKSIKQAETRKEILAEPNILNRKLKINQPWKILEVLPIAALLLYIILIPGSATKMNNGLSQLVPDINVNFSKYFENQSSSKVDNEEKNSASDQKYSTSGVYVDDESKSNLILPEDVVEIEVIENENSSNIIKNEELNTSEVIDNIRLEEPKIENGETKITEKSEPLIKEVKPNLSVPTSTSQQIFAEEKYHIIGGAFGIKENADRYLIELKSLGYNAHIIGVNKKGLHMVSVHSTNNSNEMHSELVKIKKVLNDKVWVLTN